MKFLLLLVLAGVLWWGWSKRREASPPAVGERPAERMVTCAHCGVYLPESDALVAGEHCYCSEAHRSAASRTER